MTFKRITPTQGHESRFPAYPPDLDPRVRLFLEALRQEVERIGGTDIASGLVDSLQVNPGPLIVGTDPVPGSSVLLRVRPSMDITAGVGFYRFDGTRIYDFNILSGQGIFNMEARPADATNTLRDSPKLFLRGQFWNGLNSLTHDAVIYHAVTAVTPASELRFDLPTGTLMKLLSTGAFVVGTDPGGTGLLRVGGGAKFSGGPVGIEASGAPVSQGDLSMGAEIAVKAWIQSFSSLPLVLNPLGNPVVVGTDPGGTALLRVNGNVQAGASNSGFLIGDDALLMDRNVANTAFLEGAQGGAAAGKLVIGTDPGGTASLRVGGGANVGGRFSMTANQAIAFYTDRGIITVNTTIDWNSGNVQRIILGATGLTITVTTNIVQRGVYTLIVQQDVTGSRTVVWSGVDWGATGAPTLSTAANAVDVITFLGNGTTELWGFLSGKGFS